MLFRLPINLIETSLLPNALTTAVRDRTMTQTHAFPFSYAGTKSWLAYNHVFANLPRDETIQY